MGVAIEQERAMGRRLGGTKAVRPRAGWGPSHSGPSPIQPRGLLDNGLSEYLMLSVPWSLGTTMATRTEFLRLLDLQ